MDVLEIKKEIQFQNNIFLNSLGYHIWCIFTVSPNKLEDKQKPRTKLPMYPVNDRAERHEFWPRLISPCLFFSPFLFPPNKEGRRKGELIAKIVIKSHVFLLDPCWAQNSFYLNPSGLWCLKIGLTVLKKL